MAFFVFTRYASLPTWSTLQTRTILSITAGCKEYTGCLLLTIHRRVTTPPRLEISLRTVRWVEHLQMASQFSLRFVFRIIALYFFSFSTAWSYITDIILRQSERREIKQPHFGVNPGTSAGGSRCLDIVYRIRHNRIHRVYSLTLHFLRFTVASTREAHHSENQKFNRNHFDAMYLCNSATATDSETAGALAITYVPIYTVVHKNSITAIMTSFIPRVACMQTENRA